MSTAPVLGWLSNVSSAWPNKVAIDDDCVWTVAAAGAACGDAEGLVEVERSPAPERRAAVSKRSRSEPADFRWAGSDWRCMVVEARVGECLA